MNKTKVWRTIYLILFWLLFYTPIMLSLVLFVKISEGEMGDMPSFKDLENPDNNIASEIISEDGVLLGKLFYQNRSFVGFEDLSPILVNALIATEDVRYYKHSGVDVKALMRVGWGLLSGDSKGGGSTLTQQLAKNLFGRDTTTYHSIFQKAYHMLIIKGKEWVTAVKLERNYTKDEILVMYLNTVSFGSNAFGIKTAAQTFFNTSPDSLKVEEAALLVGLVKAPTKYSPILNPEESFERRNVVLNQMYKYKYIDYELYDSLRFEPINLNYKVRSHNVGLATYFRSFIKSYLSAKKPKKGMRNYREDSIKWFTDPLYGWCHKNLKPNGKPYNLFSDGLRIYTTINSKIQRYAEEAMREHLSEEIQPVFFEEKKGRDWGPYDQKLDTVEYEAVRDRAIYSTERYRKMRRQKIPKEEILKSFKKPVKMRIFTWQGEKDTVLSPFDSLMYYKSLLRSGFAAMEPTTGHLKAYVGGINFKHFQWDNVTSGKHQAGSTFKPFLYILAMQEGLSPCFKVRNVPQTFIVKDSIWTPKSSGRKKDVGKLVTLKWGLATSENNISAWLLKRFKPKPIADIAHKMGIKSHIVPVPSLIYGTSDMSVWEMVSAYSTFANKGVNIEPIFISRIEDKNGNVLFESQPKITEAINEKTAYLMLNLMMGVVNHGTAYALRSRYNFEGEIAGKTGTTNNHSDGWFLGITPQLVAGGWVGGEDRPIRFDHIGMGQGAKLVLPMWARFFKKIYADSTLGIQPGEFIKPEVINFSLDCDKYQEEDALDSPDNYIERDFW